MINIDNGSTGQAVLQGEGQAAPRSEGQAALRGEGQTALQGESQTAPRGEGQAALRSDRQETRQGGGQEEGSRGAQGAQGALAAVQAPLPRMAVKTLEFDKVRSMVVDRCATAMGKELAEALEPTPYASQARRMLEETAEAEGFATRHGRPPLSGARDIRASARRAILGASLSGAELLAVAALLRSARGVRRYAKSAGDDRRDGPARQAQMDGIPPLRQAQMDGISPRMAVPLAPPGQVASLIASLYEDHRLESRIDACIVSEDEVADDASRELLSIRRQIRRLQDSVKDRLNEIVRSPKYQKFMQDSLVTMRQDRYVIPVKQEFRQEISGLVHDMSASGATVFIEPMAVVEANNEIRQQMAKERAEIERIMAELSAEVAAVGGELERDVEIIGALDFAFAKARLSIDLGCTLPQIGDDTPIRIKRGRHPLLPKEQAVPLDFWMADGIDAVIVTGPNTGGKTVALKTVGLFALMAQAGLFLPAAEGTAMRVFSSVFADIGDEQSIEQSLSTFSSHMRNIVRIIDAADGRALALFDEIGAGTDPAEGAAIARAVLERLRAAGAATMATTHYSELKMYALETPGVTNACCEFDVATLRPTYRLLIGVPGKSNAFAISERLGLQGDVLDRARSLMESARLEFEDALQAIDMDRRSAEEDRLAAREERKRAEAEKSASDRRARALEAVRETQAREAREAAKRYLADAKREADDILAALRRLERERDDAQRKTAEFELRARLNKAQAAAEAAAAEAAGFGAGRGSGGARGGARGSGASSSGAGSGSGAGAGRGLGGSKGSGASMRGARAEPLKKGDTVLLLEFGQRGTVLTPPDRNGDVAVQAGIMTVTVSESGLRLVDEQREIAGQAVRHAMSARQDALTTGGSAAGQAGAAGGGMPGSTFAESSRTLGARSEIDLRGMRLEEAIEAVDRALDSALLAGLAELHVIHGKGTGALRAGIQRFLRGRHNVAAFRNGSYGEGDMGVTVVSLGS